MARRLPAVAALLVLFGIHAFAQGGPHRTPASRQRRRGPRTGALHAALHQLSWQHGQGDRPRPGSDSIAVVLRDRLGQRDRTGHQARRPRIRRRSPRAQIVDLSHFLHQRVEAIASNRNARAPLQRADRRSRSRPRVLQRRRPLQHLPLADRRPRRRRARAFRTRRTCSSASSSRRCVAAAKQVEVTVTAGAAAAGVRRRWCASTTSSCRCATPPAIPGVHPRTRRDGRGARSAGRASRAARSLHRRRHAQPDGLPGDAEMRRTTRRSLHARLRGCRLSGAVVTAAVRASARSPRERWRQRICSSRRPTRGRCTTATTPAAASVRSRRSTRRTCRR